MFSSRPTGRRRQARAPSRRSAPESTNQQTPASPGPASAGHRFRFNSRLQKFARTAATSRTRVARLPPTTNLPLTVFHRPPCFVFHYFQRPCVSLCFVFQNLGGAVKARVSCFVFQIFRACSAPAAPLASGGACGGLSPLRDENLLRAAWISPTRGERT